MKSYIPKSSEDAEQEVVIKWARLSEGKWPELALLHHIPNGGSRDVREAKKLQRMGVPWHGLYIEMKYDDGRLRKTQKDFLKLAAEQGVYCVACFTAEDAIEVIRQYVSRDTKQPNLSILRGGKIVGTIE